MTESVTASLEYNWDSKLRSATAGGDSVSYKYDPRGNRVSKTLNSTTKTRYIVDIASKLPTILLEIDFSDPCNCSLEKAYVYTNSQIIAQFDGDPNYADKYFYLSDRLGSVRQVIDPNVFVNDNEPNNIVVNT